MTDIVTCQICGTDAGFRLDFAQKFLICKHCGHKYPVIKTAGNTISDMFKSHPAHQRHQASIQNMEGM